MGNELAGLRSKEARGNQSPQAPDGVNGDSAGGIVDGERQFEHFHQERRGDAGDEADEDRVERCHQRGAGAGGDQAGQLAVGAEAGVGLAEADVRYGEGGCNSRGGREHRIDRGDRKRGKRRMEPEKRAGGVEASQPTSASRQPKST